MNYEFQLHPPHDLLPGAKQIDWRELVWNLEKTVEQHPEKWGWLDKRCSVCGEEGVVFFDRKHGYRCGTHFPSDFEPLPEILVTGYTGDVDGSADYEHDWP